MSCNTELLRMLNCPVFGTFDEMSRTMHVSRLALSLYSTYSHRYYRRYHITKANGSPREIRQPNPTMKGLQAWILRNVLDKLQPSQYATAFVKKKGLIDNVLPHRQNRFFLCLDMEDFFTTISTRRVAKIFGLVGYGHRMAKVLARICTCDGSLPQGSVTSPALSNLIAAKLDRRIAGFAERRGIAYTRYADDITLSSGNPHILSASIHRVLGIIKSEHFRPNDAKTRLLGPRRCCHITGLIKNTNDDRFGIGRQKKRRMRSIMYHSVRGTRTDVYYRDRESIEGWLSFVNSVDSQSYKQMRKYWDSLLEQEASQAE